MNHLERKLQRWTEAHIIDSATADRILQFERRGGEGRRWPAIFLVPNRASITGKSSGRVTLGLGSVLTTSRTR